jgi:hypothetical protein
MSEENKEAICTTRTDDKPCLKPIADWIASPEANVAPQGYCTDAFYFKFNCEEIADRFNNLHIDLVGIMGEDLVKLSGVTDVLALLTAISKMPTADE